MASIGRALANPVLDSLGLPPSAVPGPGDDTNGVRAPPQPLAAPAGSYYVSLEQPLANLAIAALEPDTQNSFFANRLLRSLDDAARVMTKP